MFLHDSTHQRAFTSERAVVAQPSIRWSSETDGAVWSSPVVADGMLYVGCYDGNLYAMSSETGNLQWRYQTGDRIDGSPAVANGMVYFGSFDRNIYALDAKTGEERWIYGTRGIVRSSPTVKNGVVYIGAHCRTEECNAYYDVQWPETGYLYAFDAETGRLLWQHETNDGVISSPAVLDGTVYVGSSDATLYALDAATGDILWRFDADGPIMSSPVLDDGRVLFGTVSGVLYSVRAKSGDLQWSFDLNRSRGGGVELSPVITCSPVVSDETVYVGSMVPGDEIIGKLYAVSSANGTPRWAESRFAQAIGSSPVVVNDVVCFGAHIFGPSANVESGLYAVDSDGSIQWSITYDGTEHNGFGSSPAVVGTTLYIGSTESHVLAFDLA
ncbi:WD40-like repeat protein [Halogeometricum borinquense DSM 11551]|uniref:WD40-like repeat protein n=1 Tax=Halogeometricum borinquense (strain ATCC 700274 / DSM 11551 / JCM 10706 / KCTC 4070 / PR3) TaxID=469382 RepID=E4NW60_HALBP|nr:PQQ-binding-like beta-propeller repeat protein [Halogeometricum borinquense]ADQ69280.1 WD40-like repeat protein [Halogeometricum borinquense DSM 11551]ELY31764.1 WD40-like repeat protein [Halogeometricum borinquense DSM 11551]